jgi:hypothetical protein
MSGRKDPSNFGTIVSEDKCPPDAAPPSFEVAAGRYSVVMPERIILALLRTEADRLSDKDNETDLVRFFGHFFDPMISEAERNSYVSSFQRTPPVARLGYPRTGAKFPCFAIVMERDVEDQEALGKYLGQTRPGDPIERAEEYVGSMFEQTYGIYIYAEHPDMCLYLYHFAKAVLLGSHEVLEQCGILDPAYDGNEMIPQEEYLPENMFVRRLGVTLKSLHTIPAVLTPDPSRVRVTGIWANDVVVSGIRGGVQPIDPNEEDNA